MVTLLIHVALVLAYDTDKRTSTAETLKRKCYFVGDA